MRFAISKRLATEDWPEATAYVAEAERLGVDDVWSAEAWGHHTRGGFRLHTFPGDHFYLFSSRERVLPVLSEGLRPLLSPS